MGQDFDAQIQQRRNSLTGILQEMERIRGAFGIACARHAVIWWELQVTRAVENEHVVTAKLTNDQLREMKQEVTAAKNGAQATIDAEFGKDSLWWHRQNPLPAISDSQSAEDPWRYKLYGARDSDTISKAVRFALGSIALVLEKYGYLKSQEGNRQGPFAWRDGDALQGRTNARPCYRWNLEWSAEMRQTMDQYATKQADAGRLLREIGGIEEEKKKFEAQQRWKSV
jgi:hypothetical protein